MFVRFISIMTLCAALGACAQSPVLSSPEFGAPQLRATQSIDTSQMQNLGQKTLAGKVMTAIALERVTGLKPDPARFSDID